MPHIHELIDFTVGAFIVDLPRVLLIHHKKFNLWLQPGGHIELHEDPIEALHREILEETGLTIRLLDNFMVNIQDPRCKMLNPPHFMDIHEVSGTHRHVGMSYVAVPVSGELIHCEEEHNAAKWFTAEELESLPDIAVSTKAYALAAIAQVTWEKEHGH